MCLTAFLAAGVTLFSGFGLGTLLMPVFALFFPIELAIALSAIVHLFNNLLKMMLLGRYADKLVVLHFGVPAILAAFLGAWVLGRLSDLAPLMHYRLLAHDFQVDILFFFSRSLRRPLAGPGWGINLSTR